MRFYPADCGISTGSVALLLTAGSETQRPCVAPNTPAVRCAGPVERALGWKVLDFMQYAFLLFLAIYYDVSLQDVG